MLNPDLNFVAYGTDSYKVGHWPFYPPNTTLIYAYGEPRSGGMFPTVTPFGMQYVNSHLEGEFVTADRIDEAYEVAGAHFNDKTIFNIEGWRGIRDRHNGRLPLHIKALPEGMTVPESNAHFTIRNLDKKADWLTNWTETVLSQVWYPTTVMTATREVRKIIAKYLDLTGTPESLPFKLHDFGYRGVTCIEQAAIGGGSVMAAGCMGTDNMIALDFLKRYYDAEMAGFSIRATEHSIMTIRGIEGEADVVRQVLDNTPGDQMVAMVGDSYDMMGFIEKILALPDIKARIVARTAPLIVRPDSGELPQIDVDVFRALERVFGSTMNSKGFAVLPPYIAMIQGDGIKWYQPLFVEFGQYPWDVKPVKGAWRHTTEDILEAFYNEKISADNIAFGSGGGLLQQFDRDSQRFAIKASYTERDGVGYEVFKRPATDPTKNSKRGMLSVVNHPSQGIITVPKVSSYEIDMLRDVFYMGERKNIMTLEEVRNNAIL